MKKIALIQPYFGKFPNYFPLHLKSIAKNPEITWIFFTDDFDRYNFPENAKVVPMQFSEMQELAQKAFPFPISLEKPYKLCDFKPAYGVIFKKYIKEYDFWGHCDLDVIWGELKKYITDGMLEQYELLYREGALRLYKNIPKINYLFEKKGSIFNYNEVFSIAESYGFDEAIGIQRIAERNDIKLYINDNAVADIDAFAGPLYIRRVTEKRWEEEAGIFRSIKNYEFQVFQWENGKIIRYFVEDETIKTDEFMYLHLLKRKMDGEDIINNKEDTFLIVPNRFMKQESLTVSKIKELSMYPKIKCNENLWQKMIRKGKRMCKMTWKQRLVVLRKRFYFILEKFMR